MNKKYLIIILIVFAFSKLYSQVTCYVLVDYSSCHNCINALSTLNELDSNIETVFVLTEFYENYKDPYFVENVKNKLGKIIYSDSLFERINKHLQTAVYLYRDSTLLYSKALCNADISEVLAQIKIISLNRAEYSFIKIDESFTLSEFVRVYTDSFIIYILSSANGDVLAINLSDSSKITHHFFVDSQLIFKTYQNSSYKKYFKTYQVYLDHQATNFAKAIMFKKSHNITSVYSSDNFVYFLVEVKVLLPEKSTIKKELFLCSYSKDKNKWQDIDRIKDNFRFYVDSENAFYVLNNILISSVISDLSDSKVHIAKYRKKHSVYKISGKVKYPKPDFCYDYNLSLKVIDNEILHFVSTPSFFDISNNKEFKIPHLDDINKCESIKDYLSGEKDKVYIASTFKSSYFLAVLYYYNNEYYISYYSNKNMDLVKSYKLPLREKKYGSRGFLLSESVLGFINTRKGQIDMYKLN